MKQESRSTDEQGRHHEESHDSGHQSDSDHHDSKETSGHQEETHGDHSSKEKSDEQKAGEEVHKSFFREASSKSEDSRKDGMISSRQEIGKGKERSFTPNRFEHEGRFYFVLYI